MFGHLIYEFISEISRNAQAVNVSVDWKHAHIQLTTIGTESTEFFSIDPSPCIQLLLLSFGMLHWNSSALFVIAEKFKQRDCITMKFGKYSVKNLEIIIVLYVG